MWALIDAQGPRAQQPAWSGAAQQQRAQPLQQQAWSGTVQQPGPQQAEQQMGQQPHLGLPHPAQQQGLPGTVTPQEQLTRLQQPHQALQSMRSHGRPRARGVRGSRHSSARQAGLLQSFNSDQGPLRENAFGLQPAGPGMYVSQPAFGAAAMLGAGGGSAGGGPATTGDAFKAAHLEAFAMSVSHTRYLVCRTPSVCTLCCLWRLLKDPRHAGASVP